MLPGRAAATVSPTLEALLAAVRGCRACEARWPRGGAGRGIRARPRRRCTWTTVGNGSCKSRAIRSELQPHCRRRVIWRRRARHSARGERWGRLERSCKPVWPSWWYRRRHRRTVVVLRSMAAATSRSRSPASSRWIIRSRPMGVSRASLCMFAEPSGEWVGGFATPSFTRYGSVNHLFINYT